MKRLALLLVLLVSPLGCKKALDTTPGPEEKVKGLPTQGDLSAGGGGVQGVRQAAGRTVNDNNLHQLHQIIFAAQQADPDGRVPPADQIMREIAQSGKLVAMIKDETVILTNTSNTQGIWAYTKWPQRNGNHYVLMSAGRSDMSPKDLAEALKMQGSVVKLEK
jgi:hypothetical protein